ncbi:MAG: hypothetical protein EOP62_00225 [Sphingomonadales bacterium]|nr:MAG: hypothetical protein EOP62_00225 [Sphingomonadales bacterium]
MNFVRVWRRMPPLVDSQVALLQDEIGQVLDSQGLAVSATAHRESTLFVLWSVHAGLMNMRPGISRSVLLWLHKRKIAQTAKARDRQLLALYERRVIEVMFVVKNIVFERTEQGLALPLSRRTAKMFLKNLSPEAANAPVDLLDDVLLILRRRSSACAGKLLAA